MMTQSWMGSDFSYNDLAKSDQLLTSYNLRLLSVKKVDEINNLTENWIYGVSEQVSNTLFTKKSDLKK